MRFFHGGVTTANDSDILIPKKESVTRRAGRNAFSVIFFLRIDSEPLRRSARGYDQRGCRYGLPVIEMKNERTLRGIDFRDATNVKACSETLGLFAELIHQIRAHDAFGETWIIFDVTRDGQLPAGLLAFNNEGLKVRAGRVDRGGEARRACAEDDDIFNCGSFGLRSYGSVRRHRCLTSERFSKSTIHPSRSAAYRNDGVVRRRAQEEKISSSCRRGALRCSRIPRCRRRR